MIPIMAESQSTWAEDRAPVRTDPSAVPGVGVKTGPDRFRPGRFHASHQHEREKPVWQDAGLSPAGCLLTLANADQLEFQFPLNQDRGTEES